MVRLMRAIGLSAWLGTAHAAQVTYTFDSSASQLAVQVFKDNSALSDFAHDHVILATDWSGSATLDVDDTGTVQSCEVTVDVPVSGLRPDVPAIRKAFSMALMLTDAQQTQVAEHMWGDEQLDAASYSTIQFYAASCSGTLAALQVDGNLNIHGRSKAVSMTLSASAADGTLRGSGGFSLKHSDFGFSPYTAFLGTLRNKQELRFSIQVVGTSQ